MTYNLPIKPFNITTALDYKGSVKGEKGCPVRWGAELVAHPEDLLTRIPSLPRPKANPKVRVQISVVFLKIGEIDTLKENYEAEVMIRSKWREPALDKDINNPAPGPPDFSTYWNPKVFIENTIGEPKESSFLMVTFNKAGEAFVTEKRRIKGTFMENLELNDFPFDVQDLTVTLMSDRSPEEVDLLEDPEEPHLVNRQSFIDAQEWLLYKFVETERRLVTNEHEDPNVQRSALFVKCRAARRPVYFFWNIFLITFMICSLSFVTFAVDRKLTQNRLQLSFTLVLTSVAFKFVVNQSLPKISYLTYLDIYVLVAMVTLACVCCWHGILTLFPEYTSAIADIVAMCVLASLYCIFNMAFLLRIYTKPGKTRRLMKEKEKEYSESVRLQLEKNQMQPHHRLSTSNGAFSVTI